jgi:hypothetical protein
MDELRSLRRQSYEAASEFHQAHADFFKALIRNHTASIVDAAAKSLTAGAVYEAALTRLIAYLSRPELHEDAYSARHFKHELGRTEELAEMLEKSLALPASYL